MAPVPRRFRRTTLRLHWVVRSFRSIAVAISSRSRRGIPERLHREDRRHRVIGLCFRDHRPRRVPCFFHIQCLLRPVRPPGLVRARPCAQLEPLSDAVPQHRLATVRRPKAVGPRYRDLRSLSHGATPSVPSRPHPRRVRDPCYGNTQNTLTAVRLRSTSRQRVPPNPPRRLTVDLRSSSTPAISS